VNWFHTCRVCGKPNIDGQGVYWAEFRWRLHKECSDVVDTLRRDFTRSKRGRLRSRKELGEAIDAWNANRTKETDR